MEQTVLITPEADADSFTVSGITYTLQPDLSVDRARILQRYELEFVNDTSIRAVVEAADKTWAELNAGRIADAIYTQGKLRETLNTIGANRLRDVEICALFFNAPGEDMGFDFAAMQAKIAAWGAVAHGFFMVRAFALLTATSTRYPLPLPPPVQPPTQDAP